jgi:hypothetical protein
MTVLWAGKMRLYSDWSRWPCVTRYYGSPVLPFEVYRGWRIKLISLLHLAPRYRTRRCWEFPRKLHDVVLRHGLRFSLNVSDKVTKQLSNSCNKTWHINNSNTRRHKNIIYLKISHSISDNILRPRRSLSGNRVKKNRTWCTTYS